MRKALFSFLASVIVLSFISISYSQSSPITITSPSVGEIILAGKSYVIQWTAPPEAIYFRLRFSMDNGMIWKTITPALIQTTSFTWSVPVLTANKKKCLLRVIGYDVTFAKIGMGQSNAPFTIEVVRLRSPNGGEILTPSDSIKINWTTNTTRNTVGKVRLYYSKNGGIDWNLIGTVKGNNPETYDWKVPMVYRTKSNCKMMLVLMDYYGNSLGADTSDGFFTIVNNPVKPTVSLISLPPNPFGLLTTQVITWQSNMACNYAVELGGNGIPGSGTLLSSGSVAPDVPMDEAIHGRQLSFATSTPLWIYITDLLGRTGSASVDLSLKPPVLIPVGPEPNQITILPGEQRAYVVCRSNNSVAVLDTNPQSLTYNSVLKYVGVGIRPNWAASTPDGSRVYVTNGGDTSIDIDSISVIETSTDTVIDTIQFGSETVPNGIAVTPDGTRAYFASFDKSIYVLDTDPGSLTYHTIIDQIPRPLLLSGSIAISPDGSKTVVNWQGMIAHAVDIIDIDPASPTYNLIIGTPVPIVSGLGGDVAISPDNAFVYATNPYNKLCKIDLQTFDTLVNGPFAGQGAFALTPDGTLLLMGNPNSTLLSIIVASDLSLVATVDMGTSLGFSGGIHITPDGSRAYMIGNITSPTGEVIVVPLL